jgi:hypothetical protein
MFVERFSDPLRLQLPLGIAGIASRETAVYVCLSLLPAGYRRDSCPLPGVRYKREFAPDATGYVLAIAARLITGFLTLRRSASFPDPATS